MINDLNLVLCTSDKEWAEFLACSPQGTRYALKEVINSLSCKVDCWFVMSKQKIVAGIPIVTQNKAASSLPMHTYYIGLLYHNDVYNCKANRKTECEIVISEFVMDTLSEKYEKFELSLHHSISDVRGFDWFNYHTPDRGRAKISPQYTAISDLVPLGDIRTEARGSRRREAGYAQTREGLTFHLDGTVEELSILYQETFSRQSVNIPSLELNITAQFAEYLVKHDFGKIAVVRNALGEAQAAGLLFYDFNGVVHLPVVGTKTTKYGGTMLYFQMMEYAAKKGYKHMDFNGANSPSRSYFKHSIGAKAQLFFHVSWTSPLSKA